MSKYINTDDIEYITWSLYNGHDMRGNTLFIERDIVSRQIIDAMPAADVTEVVHAEWKKVSDKYPRYACTNCNHLYNNKEYRHCPWCGAIMNKRRKK